MFELLSCCVSLTVCSELYYAKRIHHGILEPFPSELVLTHVSLTLFPSAVAITWTNAPENQFPTLGTNYVVKCEVKADPNPTIDWLRNGDPVS